MFRIGEFSKLTQVTIRMLRYYDEMGLLKPGKVDSWTGYRMYSVDQIPVLNKIIYLRDSGFQVAEIRKILGEQDPSCLEKELEKKYREIERGIGKEQEKLEKIRIAKQEILNKNTGIHEQITIKSVPCSLVLSLRRVIPDYYGEGELWKEMSAFAAENSLSISSDTFSLYHDAEYKETEVDVEICAPIRSADTGIGEGKEFRIRTVEPVPFMASTMVYGSFGGIASAYRSFAGWLETNSQYRMTNPSRQIVHRGPWNEEREEKYLTEIQIPLEIRC